MLLPFSSAIRPLPSISFLPLFLYSELGLRHFGSEYIRIKFCFPVLRAHLTKIRFMRQELTVSAIGVQNEPTFLQLETEGRAKVGPPLFIWKIIQYLISNDTRINSVFQILNCKPAFPRPFSIQISKDFLKRERSAATF